MDKGLAALPWLSVVLAGLAATADREAAMAKMVLLPTCKLAMVAIMAVAAEAQLSTGKTT